MGYEFEMARQAAQAELDEINELLSQRREAAAPVPEWTPPARSDPPVQQRQRQRSSSRNWAAEEAWITRIAQQHIDQRVGTQTRAYVHDIVIATAEEAGKICGELRGRLDAADAKIAELEAEIKDLRRKAGPAPELRMVGFGGGDD